MRTLRSVLTGLGRSPFRSSLLLATIALGVAVLIFALSISSTLERLIAERLERDGLVVMVWAARQWPREPGQPQDFLDQRGVDALMREVPGAVAASLVEPAGDEYVAAGTVYQVRNVVTASASYARVMGLQVIAGSNVDAPHQALISATLAEVMFGSAAAALGQTLTSTPVAITFAGRLADVEKRIADMRRRSTYSYTVRGVFADPDELGREVGRSSGSIWCERSSWWPWRRRSASR